MTLDGFSLSSQTLWHLCCLLHLQWENSTYHLSHSFTSEMSPNPSLSLNPLPHTLGQVVVISYRDKAVNNWSDLCYAVILYLSLSILSLIEIICKVGSHLPWSSGLRQGEVHKVNFLLNSSFLLNRNFPCLHVAGTVYKYRIDSCS